DEYLRLGRQFATGAAQRGNLAGGGVPCCACWGHGAEGSWWPGPSGHIWTNDPVWVSLSRKARDRHEPERQAELHPAGCRTGRLDRKPARPVVVGGRRPVVDVRRGLPVPQR